MKKFIGVKLIKAAPMTREEAEKNHGVVCGGDNHGDGYLVDYQNGYKSWSPKDVFEEAYKECGDMSFGLAIEAMRKGFNVSRKGWNGKGIFIGLMHTGKHSHMTQSYLYIDTCGLSTDNPHAPRCRVPWLASQTDMLADDWMIVE